MLTAVFTLKSFSLHECRAAISGLLLAALAACVSASAAPASPHLIAADAKSNGIAIRPADGAVFITDDRSNSVLMLAGGTAFARYATLPGVKGQPNSLSQLAFSSSGGLLVQRFGFGTDGAIFDIAGPGAVAPLTGLVPTRRRLGLAPVDSGRALSSWFIKDGDHPPQGGLSLITYDPSAHSATESATERDLLIGLGKPVGVAIAGDAVFVADQAGNAIFRASLERLLRSTAASAPDAKIAHVVNPDMMAADTNGTLYTKCNAGDLCAIAADGAVTVMANGFHDARGVAIDARRRLLYVVDRAAAPSDGATYIRAFSLK